MKKFSLLVLVILLMIPVMSLAEMFAFEKLEYEVVPGKTVTLKPVAQGIDEKLTYKWKTEDKTIAITSKGVVTAKKTGVTTVKCTATTQSGKEYIAVATINVLTPVKSITVKDKTLNLPKGAFYKQEFSVEPEEASNKEIEWYSSNPDVAYVFENGNIQTFARGKATVTGKAKDGSGKKVNIEVNVPALLVTEKELVIDKPEGKLFGYQINANGIHTVGTTGSAFYTERPDEEPDIYGQSCDMNWMMIMPSKAGTGSIKISVNGSVSTVKVTVKSSAVVDKSSYKLVQAKNIVEDLDAFKGEKIFVKGEIQETKDQEGKIIVYAKQDGQYFAFEIDASQKRYFTEGTLATVYGTCEEIVEYKTETDLSFECPFFDAVKVEYEK